MTKNLGFYCLAGASVLAIACCSGFSGVGGGSSGSSSGIFGIVTGSNSSFYLNSVSPKGRFEVKAEDDVSSMAISGCTVTASELNGADTAVATATSDSSGKYDLI